MTWVKVCGVRTPADAAVAAAAGADAVGVVFVRASPRYIDPAGAAAVLDAARPVEAVILTLDLAPDDLLSLAFRVGADGVQPYGEHARESCVAAQSAGLRVLVPVPATEIGTVPSIPDGHTPLIDHRSGNRLGGTGQTFDWSLLAGIGREYVLAGGLGAGNVAEAVRSIRPWGVDASSGLESAPGVKDPARIRAFVQAARDA